MIRRALMFTVPLVVLSGSSVAFSQPPAPPPPTTQVPPDKVELEETPAPAQTAPAPAPAPAPVPAPPPAPLLPPPGVAPPPPGAARYSPAPVDVRRDQAETEPEPAIPPGDRARVSPWAFRIGLRTAFLSDEGYDPFDDNNGFNQLSLAAGRVLYGSNDVSIALLAFWDYGSTESNVRGESTELEVHRLTLAPELRLHLFPQAYVFGRLAVGTLHASASLGESTTQTKLHARSWTFAADATAGAALRAVQFSPRATAPSIWLFAEGGYGWAPSVDLVLAPDDDDTTAPQRVADMTLGQGDVGVRGALFRVMVGLSF